MWASFTGQSQRGLSLWSAQDRRGQPAGIGLLESLKQGLKGWSLTNDELEEARARGDGDQEHHAVDSDGVGRDAVFDEGDWIGTTGNGDTEFYDDDDDAWFEVRHRSLALRLSTLADLPPPHRRSRCC
jgi:hypothetical protein